MSRVPGGTTTSRGGGQRSTGTTDRVVRAQKSGEFFRGLVSEMRRVTWPSREEWVAATLLTIGLVVTIAIYTYALDLGFGALFDFIHK